MPVFPLVGSSRMVSEPGPIVPARSASSINDRAIRSLTLPDGLLPSSLAKSRTPARGLKRWSSTSGVCPIDSTMLANFMISGSRLRRVLDLNSRWTGLPIPPRWRGFRRCLRLRCRYLHREYSRCRYRKPSSLASAGDGRQDRDRVVGLQAGVKAAEIPDVLVVHVDVDEPPERA